MVELKPVTAIRNPYPGLRPFRTDEEHLFFGRERQVDRMIDKLGAHRFLAVVGSSGSGKSSLVNCGLRPALHRGYMASAGAAWRMAQFRPGRDPIGALARALAEPGVFFDKPMEGALSAETLVDATLRLGSLGLVDMVEQADLPPGTQLLVVADQFEELFRFRALARGARKDGWSPSEDATALVRLLLEAAAQTAVPIYVVLTMRSDFLGDCAQFQGLPEAINEGQYLVPRLTREEIRAAITGPAGVAGAAVSPVLITRLLNDVGDNPDQLSILQHALNRTFANWENECQMQGALGLQHYEAIGGMAEALDRHAEKAYGELGSGERQRLCERVFKTLTDTGTDARGIRRPAPFSVLAEITGARPEELQAVIDVFRKPSRSFLMPPLGEKLSPESVIDISHESLMRVWARLKTWANEEARSARIYRRLRETAIEHDKGDASLWRDPDLRVVLDWRERNKPNMAWAEMYGGGFDRAMGFLDRSRDQQNKEKIEEEIERRWLAGYVYIPLALVAVPFFFLHDFLADALNGEEVREFLDILRIGDFSAVLSHLASGVPAVLGFLLLAPYIKRQFRQWMLREIEHQGGVLAIPDKAVAAAPLGVPSADIEALGYARFGRRALARLFDWTVCMFLLFLLVLLFADYFEDPLTGLGLDEDDTVVVFMFCWVLMLWLYQVPLWTSKVQATPGMLLFGIIVTDLEGRRLTRMRATGRFFARMLSYYTVFIGFLIQPFNTKHQTLHDLVSGTLVLRRPPKSVP